jgi:hypothetical protein
MQLLSGLALQKDLNSLHTRTFCVEKRRVNKAKLPAHHKVIH